MSDMRLPKGLATRRLRATNLEADTHTAHRCQVGEDLGELILVRRVASVSKALGQEQG